MKKFTTYGGLIAYRVTPAELVRYGAIMEIDDVLCTHCERLDPMPTDGTDDEIDRWRGRIHRAEYYVPAIQEALCKQCFGQVNVGLDKEFIAYDKAAREDDIVSRLDKAAK